MSTISIEGASLIGARRERSRRARRAREVLVRVALNACGLFTILTTIAIIVVLFDETLRFFGLKEVSLLEFVTGTQWSPLLGAQKHFGIWPLVCGTMLVTSVAMLVALPLGLVTAIFLSEYAPRRMRAIIKPLLEILAGIPTVVFGFFALTVITPGLQWLHSGFQGYNALSAGLAVGIMCLPIVCSLAEDALQAVPRSLREGAYAAGATKFDVSVKIVVPAALSGIIAAFLLAIARAVGETMIVALAAGNAARMTLDPREEVQTMTAYMVQIFLGDVSNFGPEYYSSYAVACSLFLMTFALTLIGHRVRVRFREVYE
jgi:phosphate transport system permease protein